MGGGPPALTQGVHGKEILCDAAGKPGLRTRVGSPGLRREDRLQLPCVPSLGHPLSLDSP